MYFGAQAKIGAKFSQTVGNNHVRFVPWHLRSIIDEKTGLSTGRYTVDDPQAEEWFERWKTGRTGFPWIDAVMRQLKQEGWVHHLARHAVACFLTRGGCYVDWERGAEVFEEWLIDHEVACNAGNWQWLSCTAFFAQFYRCYSPISFPQKTDKNGDFVRQYVPELKDYPAKFIYEPWKAPISDQKKAKCRISGDGTEKEVDGLPSYPMPMFDFSERRQICIDGMKNTYNVRLYGNDPKVLDGTWPKAFSDQVEGPTKGKNVKEQKEYGEMDEGDVTSDSGGDADHGHEPGTKPKKGEKRKKQGTLDGHISSRKAQKGSV
jgi:cryptochrome